MSQSKGQWQFVATCGFGSGAETFRYATYRAALLKDGGISTLSCPKGGATSQSAMGGAFAGVVRGGLTTNCRAADVGPEPPRLVEFASPGVMPSACGSFCLNTSRRSEAGREGRPNWRDAAVAAPGGRHDDGPIPDRPFHLFSLQRRRSPRAPGDLGRIDPRPLGFGRKACGLT